ncbi:MAG: pyrroline-5-carboxylate reductase [Actinomycetaceae bacterium]|nr:pyrroline-5-carboxylate reductase [Arcanobacterium sp.]MDD7505796.1 pyrroline-5-carboxylate reductase [Actinomycetaceae bacterium]MDY6142893.1 pyrroline-5-carboxylate reductase [Arcanobacterium sp.]
MIGFIGTGSMGGAILRGVLKSKIVAPDRILFTRKNPHKAEQLSQELGVHACSSNSELVARLGHAGVIILGVKPHMIADALEEIREEAARQKSVIVSIAAGVTLEALSRHTDDAQPLVRAMPNVASSIGMGMTALCPNGAVSPEALEQVRAVFTAVGQTVQLAEKDFSAFTAIAGSSPAWTFSYIDALSKAALAAGLTKDDSVRIASQAVLGSAQLALNQLEGGTRPQALIDTVTSPGGTTIAGIVALDHGGFTAAVIDAVNAAIARDQQLG